MTEIPFTAEQFFGVFARYNDSVWPWQFVLALIAAAVAIGAWRRPDRAGRMVPAFLAVLWIWSAIAYHLVQFARINPAAYLFGGLFVLQGVLWMWAAGGDHIRFADPRGTAGTLGAIGLIYALVIYPVLGALLGHPYPATPTFGAPCPSTIFTFGILLWARPPVPMRLVVIPFLWAVLTAPMAMGWGVPQDGAMPLIAIVAVLILGLQTRRSLREAQRPRGRTATT